MYKLLLGGSPCTYWSIAQTKNRETKPSGLGWELFKNYLIALEKYKPDYFLYENNFSMDSKIRNEITKQFGVEPIMINSALVSAQSRKRLYWTNIPNVKQPEDKGILLKDILESGDDLTGNNKSYRLTASYSRACAWNTIERNQRNMVAEAAILQRGHGFNKGGIKQRKVPTVTASGSFIHNNKVIEPCCIAERGRYSESGSRSKKINGSKIEQYYEARTDGKTNTLTTVAKANEIAESVRIGTIENGANNPNFDSKQYRVYSPFAKSTTLCGQGGGLGAKTGLYATPIAPHKAAARPIYEVKDGKITANGKTYPIKLKDGFYIIRLLTVLECKRLQTVPEDYIMPCSSSQNYKMLGNGWTIDVIAHILSHIPNISDSDVEVLSMYDGMSCGHIALDKLGANVINYYATEIDRYAIETTFTNYPKTIFLGNAFNVRKESFTVEAPKSVHREIKSISGEQISLF